MTFLTRRKLKSILVTGANGFIGKVLTQLLADKNYFVRATVTRIEDAPSPHHRLQWVATGDLANKQDFSMIEDIDAVIHLAGRSHVLKGTATIPLAEYRKANVDGTLTLTRQAAEAGVDRFIFISSIGVNGDLTYGTPFNENFRPAPYSDYSLSKLEAEQVLQDFARRTEMETVIIRPPLVYGPGAPGNFERLIEMVSKGYPMPFGAIRNKRSFVSIYNLADFIVTCLEHPAAANQTFLVSDGEDLSTTELLRRIAAALNVPARLLPVPQKLIEASLKLVGKSDLSKRLCGSLQADITKARTMLDWKPLISVDEGLCRTAEHFFRDRV